MRIGRMTLPILALTALVSWTSPAEAQGNWKPGDFGAFRIRVGMFRPNADSQYWNDKFIDFTGSAKSFEDVVFGADYLWGTSSHGALLFGSSYFNGEATQAYRDWVDPDGRDIAHATRLTESDFTVAYVLRLGTHGLRPYLGGGGGLLWWSLREQGWFIDFGDQDLPIVSASYYASGTTWEAFAVAGFDIPVGYQWSFFFEGRYRWADAELTQDFVGFGTIDLSGYELTGGFSWNF